MQLQCHQKQISYCIFTFVNGKLVRFMKECS